MLGDTTIRVDGTNNSPLASAMLIGHITTSNALTATPANFTNYTLTKTGTGQLRIDPANGYSGGNIHIVGGFALPQTITDYLQLHWLDVEPQLRLHRTIQTLNLHPADGVGTHEAAFTDMARAMGLDPAKVDRVPFDCTDRRYIEAYFKTK